MLYLFGFKRLGVVLADLYFVDPDPGPGQDGPERGVRLEVRFLEEPEAEGSIYAARPIVIDQPIWRVDLLESVDHPGTLDRAHHHPKVRGWEPGRRKFEPHLTADPLAWVAAQLDDLTTVVAAAGLEPDLVDAEDLSELRSAVPEIITAIRSLLARIGNGDLAVAPSESGGGTLIRTGWL